MIFPTITAASAGVLAILTMLLMLRAGFGRVKFKQSIGDGGDVKLLQRIRVHGNITENVPIFLIVLGLLEVSGASISMLKIIAAVFILARISHAIALSWSPGPTALRGLGAMTSTMTIMFTAGVLLWKIAPLI